MGASGPNIDMGTLGVLMAEPFGSLRDLDGALPLYLQSRNDLSESGCGRPSLPEVFKTVSSAFGSPCPDKNAKARTVAWDEEPASRKDGLRRWRNYRWGN